ncbi:MAG: hypothetical protein HFACDABA_00732 [Anaerolineales bacterium]|nr:hypothetical protein [Anaerolineales bacterium]
MRINRFILVFWIALCALLITSCTPGKTQSTQRAIVTPPITSDVASVATPTAWLMPFPSPTPIPAIPHSAQQQLFSILANNGGCELPCFLGIVPGTTLWSDAQTILEEFSWIKPIPQDPYASTTALTSYTTDIYTSYEVTLDGYIKVEVDNKNVVQNIVFRSEIKQSGNLGTRDRHLSWYSMSEILKRHGIPDAIYLYYTNRTLVYTIDMIYEKQKFVVEYTGLASLNTDYSYTLCPDFGDGSISYFKIGVAKLSSQDDVKLIMGNRFWESMHLLEEITQINYEEYFTLINNFDIPACFIVKKP